MGLARDESGHCLCQLQLSFVIVNIDNCIRATPTDAPTYTAASAVQVCLARTLNLVRRVSSFKTRRRLIVADHDVRGGGREQY